MRIERITDMGEIVKIVPVERRVRAKNREHERVSDYLVWIKSMVEQPWFAVWMVYGEHDEIAGYAVCMIPPVKLLDLYSMHILRIWYDPHHEEAMEMLVGAMEGWCITNKVPVVRFETKRGIKALQKKWGFKVKSIVMERRI